jgi:competence protein ComGC
MKTTRLSVRAFTLIEIMIILLIVGILVGIAIPGWIKARKTAWAKTCHENQAQFAGALDTWAFENNKDSGEPGPSLAELIGPESFMKKTPKCPMGPTLFEVPNVGAPVVCPNFPTAPEHELP